MKKFKKIIAAVMAALILSVSLTACGQSYYPPDSEENIYYDIVAVMSKVNVAEGFFASYASTIPSVFVEDNYTLTYEIIEYEGREVYKATVSGQYYPDYKDTSTKTGSISFIMELGEKKGTALAPWPYEDPDRIDDVIWQFITHKDISKKER